MSNHPNRPRMKLLGRASIVVKGDRERLFRL